MTAPSDFPSSTHVSPSPATILPTTTRRHFLALSAVATAATFALPALPARAIDLALTSELRFLQNVEFFQNQFFSRALRSGLIDPISPAEAKILLTIASEDSEQARWFRAARAQRGVMPSRANMPSSITDPNFQMGTNYASREKFLASAITIKSTAVGAFHGIVGKGGGADITQAVAALAGVQNRHLAMIKEMAGLNPFDTYVEAVAMDDASQTLSQFGFDTEAGI